MPKTKKNRKSIIKTIAKTTKSALPVVDKGLQTVGTTAKNVALVSLPVVEKGVSAVYGTMAQGFDLGVKGVKSVAKGVKMTKKRRHNKSGRRKSRKH
jgi:hypothetical protein